PGLNALFCILACPTARTTIYFNPRTPCGGATAYLHENNSLLRFQRILNQSLQHILAVTGTTKMPQLFHQLLPALIFIHIDAETRLCVSVFTVPTVVQEKPAGYVQNRLSLRPVLTCKNHLYTSQPGPIRPPA